MLKKSLCVSLSLCVGWMLNIHVARSIVRCPRTVALYKYVQCYDSMKSKSDISCALVLNSSVTRHFKWVETACVNRIDDAFVHIKYACDWDSLFFKPPLSSSPALPLSGSSSFFFCATYKIERPCNVILFKSCFILHFVWKYPSTFYYQLKIHLKSNSTKHTKLAEK